MAIASTATVSSIWVTSVATAPASAAPIVSNEKDNWQNLAEPLESCRLKQTIEQVGPFVTGFPFKSANSALGNVKIAVVPVDFSNAVGTSNPGKLYSKDVQLMKNWARHFSRGKMTYDIEFYSKSWIRAPKGAEWYTCNQCKGNKKELQPRTQAVQQLVAAADKVYDFTGVEMIYFVFPAKAEEKYGTTVYGFNENYTTKEGPITASVYGEMGGTVDPRPPGATLWDHAIHELLHFQGFIGHGPSNWTGHFITVDQWGPSKAVTSWEAFLSGWFDEREILCIDKSAISGNVVVTMESIDTFGPGKESIMIRLNDSELIVVERREKGPFTKICPTCYSAISEGFTAYRVNVNKLQFRDDSDKGSDSKNFWSFLGSKRNPTIGKSVKYSGVTIAPIGKKQVRISVG